jgi:hypothetical protein
MVLWCVRLGNDQEREGMDLGQRAGPSLLGEPMEERHLRMSLDWGLVFFVFVELFKSCIIDAVGLSRGFCTRGSLLREKRQDGFKKE